MSLEIYGWNEYWQAQFSESNHQLKPGRIIRQHRQLYHLVGENGEYEASLSGRYLHQLTDSREYPTVGDWVAFDPVPNEEKGVIQRLLSRRSAFVRNTPGEKTEAQVVAANVDKIFLVSALDEDFNLRRIERYLTEVWESGATPVIILNKIDKCDDPDLYSDQVGEIALGVDIVSLSATENIGFEQLQRFLKPKQTIALLGSSGVGKSSIINRLLGYDKMKVSEISDEKSKGRHTTTHRELTVLDNGTILIDTPGLRSIRLWADEDSLDQSFADIDQLARDCRFVDCEHGTEPGCAVKAALDDGTIDQKRFNNYLKMRRELASLERRKSDLGRHLDKVRGKKFAQRRKEVKKQKPHRFER